ncbi:replicative DNA helicase [Myroides marinus]|uniref:replicative DNA helicase n=1 Tax=Myroides marinus TaxID=703342 RepID=UPI0025791AFB|nr:replicative DNA helicase [Myroides marinus]MDM1378803.1 replicative DNA helicase [Myroides marinus]MDM1386074.1 replicative DNA helicase [Myroides marinus]MDM1393287.1 replicative DNA helicase [Myroides marinus]
MSEVVKKDLPHSFDIEEAVIGAMLVDKNGADDAMQIIKDSSAFYNPKHIDIFEAIQKLYSNSEPIDMLTVAKQLRANGSSVVAEDIVNITQKVVSSAHIEYHSMILLQYRIRRMIVMFNTTVTLAAMDETVDVFDLLARWQNEFDAVAEVITKGKASVSIHETMKELTKRIEFISKSTGEDNITGIPTGFKRVDRFTSGYQPGDLIILAARPGMGKTSLVLKTVLENAKAGNAVGFYSLEMDRVQLTGKIVANDTNYHLSQILKTGFDKPHYWESYMIDHHPRISNYPIHIVDEGGGDISDIVVQARQWKRKHNIKLLVVDYLQLVGDKTKKGNRENEVSSVSRRFKLLAKELKIPVIVLAQLSRAVESRPAKRPLLSDLRESGSIEQDADIVQFIYRPGYYGIEIEGNYEYELMVKEGANTEIIFAKYRGGSTGVSNLLWIGDKTKFVDPTDPNESVVKLPEVSVYSNPNQLVGNLPNGADVFGDSNPF